MKNKILASVALLVLIPVLAAAQSEPRAVTADISFAFSVGKEILPAGTYGFKPDLRTKIVTVTNKSTGQRVMASTTSRLSVRSQTDSVIFFDKIADQYILSEVYLAGIDGFCFAGAAGEHTHATVMGR